MVVKNVGFYEDRAIQPTDLHHCVLGRILKEIKIRRISDKLMQTTKRSMKIVQ